MGKPGYIAQCAVCHRIRVGGHWCYAMPEQHSSHYTHGYCPKCLDELMAEIRRMPWKKTRRAVRNGSGNSSPAA